MTREEVAAALRCLKDNLRCDRCAECAYGIHAGSVWCCDRRSICEDALHLIEGAEGGDCGGMAD